MRTTGHPARRRPLICLVLCAVTLLLTGQPVHAQRSPQADSFVVSTYNIRHGRGMDGVVDLARTGRAIGALGADVVALQEVDRLVTRSGRVDEPAELGAQLGMSHAFGAFMPYQGGEYGLAILSRFPIRRQQALRLPDGNEPRVALLAEVELPSQRRVLVVNVHFDWVANDSLRYRQVESLTAVLDTVSLPVVLLGDFNDQPGSRTLTRWADRFRTVPKPASDRFTFSSTEPTQEIDHILLAPRSAWTADTARVVTDPLTSDHRAVVARVRLVERARRGTH
jgi:endonuclease/exonuclease/phosphatase family metal-dependent hydrolase